MNNKIDTVNGKEVTEFKRNTDYFEMSDGVFWTVDALMKKYEIARSTLYNKVRDNNITGMKVLDIQCFKDDDRFAKQKNGAGNIEHLRGHQLTSYAELHRKIEELLTSIRAQTLPKGIDGIASQVEKAIGEMFAARTEASANLKQQYQAITANTNTHNDWHAQHNKELSRLNNTVKETNRLLNEVLNYLTTNAMEKEVNKNDT
jgi:hypothetical protein